MAALSNRTRSDEKRKGACTLIIASHRLACLDLALPPALVPDGWLYGGRSGNER